LTAELARTADIGLGLLALVFVLFDSLNKKADCTSLKKELDLRQGQLLGKLVREIEGVIAPLLGRRAEYDLGEDLTPHPLVPSFDDSARDALIAVVRNNEDLLSQVRMIKRLPKVIHRLNSMVYWLIVVVAIVSFSCAGYLFVSAVSTETIWFLFGMPIAAVAAAAVVAIVRQTKVQNAEKEILSTDSPS